MSKSIATIALERRVDALFARYTKSGSPGAVVAVMREGEIELCKGYGLASIELGVPIGPRTRFRIASVSKQFTVTAALMLAEEGKLKLDDPPHKYLKELKPLPVTIDQMMRNSSGLPDFLELLRLGGHGLDKPARAADLLAAAARNKHLNFAPGSRFLYSNTNFLLLGLIIEKLAGKKLGDHVFSFLVNHAGEPASPPGFLVRLADVLQPFRVHHRTAEGIDEVITRGAGNGPVGAEGLLLFQDLLDTIDDHGHVDRCRVQVLPTREGEQMPRQRGAALCGAEGYVQRRNHTGIIADAAFSHFEVPDNRCEQIVEIVSDTAGQLTDGFHLEGLVQLIFGNLPLCDFRLQSCICGGELPGSLGQITVQP